MAINRLMSKYVKKLALKPGFRVCELGDQMITWVTPNVHADGFYREIGCGEYISIDGNGRGTVVADLNYPLPTFMPVVGEKNRLREWGQFDLVTDFGTGEHIFDQCQVWKTIHDLVKPGGFVALIRPTQGYQDHGFYNVHPTWISDIAAANCYDVSRFCQLTMTRGDNLFVIMRKLADTPFRIPQQGKYKKTLRPLRSIRC